MVRPRIAATAPIIQLRWSGLRLSVWHRNAKAHTMTAPPRLDPNPAPHSAAAHAATPAPPSSTPASPPWHTLSAPACAQQLGVESAPGLSHPEAALRLQQHGANKLAEPPPRPLWRGLLDQFKSMLIIILLVAAVIAAFIGDFKSVTVILVVVCFNAVLGFWQEYRAEKTLAALKKIGRAHV